MDKNGSGCAAQTRQRRVFTRVAIRLSDHQLRQHPKRLDAVLRGIAGRGRPFGRASQRQPTQQIGGRAGDERGSAVGDGARQRRD